MKPRSTKAIWIGIYLACTLIVGMIKVCAQQPTPTMALDSPLPVVTPTPERDFEDRIRQLEIDQAQTNRSLELSTTITAIVGGFFALLVAFQTIVQGLTTIRRWHPDEERSQADREGVEQVSNVMSVLYRTLESRLDQEKRAREEASKARSELDQVHGRLEVMEQFFEGFQETIKRMRKTLEDRASQWAKTTPRHDFRGIAGDLNGWAEDFEVFRERFEPIATGPRTPFDARVPYIRGIAAHYANQPAIAKQYLDQVIESEKCEEDEIPLHFNRRIANAYYYLGLIQSNFGNFQAAIDLFEEANKRDLQERDFLTRVVTAEAYAMDGRYDQAEEIIDYVEQRLDQIEKQEGFLRNYHLRLRSRAKLIRANIVILRREEGVEWHQEVQALLDPVYRADPQYYYATATLAQVYYDQDDSDEAQRLFRQAYTEIEHSGHLLTVTETRSKILLRMVAGMCCKRGYVNERWSEEHLDDAEHLLDSLPVIGSQTCTVFSTLSKKNEKSEIVRRHIGRIREDQVLLEVG